MAVDWQPRLEAIVEAEFASNDDGAHDIAHIRRVWSNCQEIAQGEPPVDRDILIAAAWLHDIVHLPKNHPERHQVSRAAASHAREKLRELDFPSVKLDAVAHAIEAHSFSAKIPCRTAEARILQDADRLDALGAIGIARTFYAAGKMGSALFHPTDPEGRTRELDDKAFGLDHFPIKLFRIGETMQTRTGQRLAQTRIEIMRRFCTEIVRENG